jgi:hypothetical protein
MAEQARETLTKACGRPEYRAAREAKARARWQDETYRRENERDERRNNDIDFEPRELGRNRLGASMVVGAGCMAVAVGCSRSPGLGGDWRRVRAAGT